MRYFNFSVHLRYPRRALLGDWDTKTKLAAVLMTEDMDETQRRDWSYEQGLFPTQLRAWRRVAEMLKESDLDVVQEEFEEARKIVAMRQRRERKVIVPFPSSEGMELPPEKDDVFF